MHLIRIFIICFVSSFLYGMEQKKNQQFSLFPRELIAIIAKEAETIQPHTHEQRSTGWASEMCRMSTTWNSLSMTEEDLFAHQLWYRDRTNEDSNCKFRFDNDLIGDCNEFICKRLAKVTSDRSTKFDGPNIDDANHKGVILIGHNYQMDEEKPKSAFYLFKLHGVSSEKYTGLQPVKKMERMGGKAIIYENFPYESTEFEGETIDYCALASKNKFAIASLCQETKKRILRLFSYTASYDEKSVPEQSFQVTMDATLNDVPLFKKLCWIYERALLAVTQDGQLYTIAPEKDKITLCKQKIPLFIKDIAVHHPDDQHRILLCDNHDSLYLANLKEKNKAGAFIYRCLYTTKEDRKKNVPHFNFLSSIDRLWFYDTTIGVMDLITQLCGFLPPRKSYETQEINQLIKYIWTLKSKERV